MKKLAIVLRLWKVAEELLGFLTDLSRIVAQLRALKDALDVSIGAGVPYDVALSPDKARIVRKLVMGALAVLDKLGIVS